MILYHFQQEDNRRFVWESARGPEATVAPDAAPEAAKPADGTARVEADIDQADTEDAVQVLIRKQQDELFREVDADVQGVKARVGIFVEGLTGPIRGAVEKKIDEITERKLDPMTADSKSRLGIAVRNSTAWLRMSSGTAEDMAWLTKKLEVCNGVLAGLDREKVTADSELRSWKDAQKRLGSKRWIPRPNKAYNSWRVALRADRNRTPLREVLVDVKKAAQARKTELEKNVRQELNDISAVETNFRRVFFLEYGQKNPEVLKHFERMLDGAMKRGDPALEQAIEQLEDSARKDMLVSYYEELTGRRGHIWYETGQNALSERAQKIDPLKFNKLPVGRHVDVRYSLPTIGKDKDGNPKILDYTSHSAEGYVIPGTTGDANIVTVQFSGKKIIGSPDFPERMEVNLSTHKTKLIGRIDLLNSGKTITKTEEYDFNPASDEKRRVSFEAIVPTNF